MKQLFLLFLAGMSLVSSAQCPSEGFHKSLQHLTSTKDSSEHQSGWCYDVPIVKWKLAYAAENLKCLKAAQTTAEVLAILNLDPPASCPEVCSECDLPSAEALRINKEMRNLLSLREDEIRKKLPILSRVYSFVQAQEKTVLVMDTATGSFETLIRTRKSMSSYSPEEIYMIAYVHGTDESDWRFDKDDLVKMSAKLLETKCWLYEDLARDIIQYSIE